MPFTGTGGIWAAHSGDFVVTNKPGDAAGLADAKSYVSTGGFIELYPGTDGIALGAGWANICLVRITATGTFGISGFQILDLLDPTKVLQWSVSGIATGTTRTVTAPNWSGVLLMPGDHGTSGFFLKSNGVGAQPTWAAVSITNNLLDGANHSDTQAFAAARGALIVGDSNPKWTRLSIGTSGQVLTSDGSDVGWSSSPSVQHNALLHIKPIRATGCAILNNSFTLTTTGNQFANVKVGDVVGFPPNLVTTLVGARVATWTDANTVVLDTQNTSGNQAALVAIFTPSDHFDDSASFATADEKANGYVLAYGKGTYVTGGAGTTFQELRGPFRWQHYVGGGSVPTDFRIDGSTSTVSPNGFAFVNHNTSNRAYIHTNDLAAGAVVLRLGNPATGEYFIYANTTQTLTNKTLDTVNKIVTDGTNARTVFQSAALVDRLGFDLTAMSALRSVSWPDYAGRVPVEGAAVTFTDTDTTPTVAGSRLFKTANTGATSITTFDNGVAGQEITIIFGDGNTTLVDGGTLVMQGSANKTFASTDTWTGVYDGSVWYEKCRSIN